MDEIIIYYRGLLRSCNYNCAYCPFTKAFVTENRLRKDEEALNRFCDMVPRMGSELYIMLVPYGEALIHPYYWDAMSCLCGFDNVKRVSCQTNLSFSVQDFLAHTVGFHDKLRLWCSFHPSQTDVSAFASRCMLLYENGVLFSVGVVGDSSSASAIAELRRKLPPEVYLWINAEEGVREAQTAGNLSETAECGHPAIFEDTSLREGSLNSAGFGERDRVDGVRLSVDPYYCLEVMKRPADPARCTGGRSSFFIEGNGDVYACNISRVKLGNLYVDEGARDAFRLSGAFENSRYIGDNEQNEYVENSYGDVGKLPDLGWQGLLGCDRHIADNDRNEQGEDNSVKTLCRVKDCHCYLAYVNRRDVRELDAFGAGRFCRVPERRSAIFFDIDGTLTDGSNRIADDRARELRRLVLTNRLFLATSLPFDIAKRKCQRCWRLFEGGVFANGADIRCFKDGYKRIIPLGEDVAAMIPEGFKYRVYSEGGVPYKVAVVGGRSFSKAGKGCAAAFAGLGYGVVYEDNVCGVTAAGVSKLSGIVDLCGHLCISEQDVSVVGNGDNDLEMMEYFED